MNKNMKIIVSVLQPLVNNGIISQKELDKIKNMNKVKHSKKRPDSFKTIEETCQLLHIQRQTLHVWMRNGKLEYTRLSKKKTLIYESSITRLIEEHKNISI